MNRASHGDFTQIHHSAWPTASVDEWRCIVDEVSATLLPGPTHTAGFTWGTWMSLVDLFKDQLKEQVESSIDGFLNDDMEEWSDDEMALLIPTVWSGLLGGRVTQFLIALCQAQELSERISMFAMGELCWLADQGTGLRGWRTLQLGTGRPLKSTHRSEPPHQAQRFTSQHLDELRLPILESRLAYDEARLILRFVGRAQKRNRQIFWRAEDPTASYFALSGQSLDQD